MMRIGLLAVVGLVCLLAGGTCLPIINNTPVPPQGTTLGISILAPTQARTVGEGTPVQIQWAAGNLTGQAASVSLVLESRTNLAQTTLVEGVDVPGTGGSGTFTWDTDGFSGPYAINAFVSAGGSTQMDTAKGLITVHTRPVFEFTAPSGDVEFPLGSTTPLTISWTGSGEGAAARIGLDPDTDPNNGNEIIIDEPNLPVTLTPGSFSWAGKDTSGNSVSMGTYNLFGAVDDGVNPVLIANGLGQITVFQPQSQFTFTAPSGAVEFQLDSNTPLTISWTGSGVNATTRIALDPDTDPNNDNQIVIDEPNLPPTLGSQSFDWTGTDPNGNNVAPNTYNLRATVSDGVHPVLVANGLGQITVFHQRPAFTFTAPTGPAQFHLNSTTPLTISWTGSAAGATTRIELDPDTDPNSGNEIVIDEPNLPLTSGPGSFDWNGKDPNGNNVAVNTYNLRATVNDTFNPVLIANGLGQITVLPAVPTTPEIIEPAGDVDFLIPDPNTLLIEYKINNSADVLVDVKIDPDDNHTDGNERTILAQQFVGGGTDPNSFEWNGADTSDPNTPVPPGIYRIYLSVSTGGAPTTTDAKGFVFRRSDPNQPLIALLAPTAATRVDVGSNLTIRWRDNDPAANATIRLVVANTPIPADHESDPNALVILSGRPAAGGGVLDTFNWQIPSASILTPNTPYFIIAYIQNQDAGLLHSDSVAAGRVIVNDPNSP